MNKLTIDLKNVVVELPETYVIIEKEEYEALKEASQTSIYLSLSQVTEMLSVSRQWLMTNVLLNPKIRPNIDIDKSDAGFVKYPKNQGGRYFFHAEKTRRYFDENFALIMKMC